MRADTPDAPPNVEVESFRYLSKDGKTGTVSIVVGGVHHLFPCKLVKALYFAGGVMDVAVKKEEGGC